MSIVQELIVSRREGNLDHDQRLRLKQNGRPMPKLHLTQSSKNQGKDINRYFKETMYLLCDWICGCEYKNALFCFPCLLFSEDPLWTKHGVTDLKHLKEKIKKHSTSVAHMNSSMSFASLGHVDIKLQLDSAFRRNIQGLNESVTKNRYILNKIIDCIKFCGIFELALRVHDETESSEHLGVFRGLINFVSELDTIFKDHLDKSTVFKGISKTIQDEILDSMFFVMQSHIATEIEQSRFLAIQVDEATDSSNKKQMIFIFRYVLNGIVHERFWKFINPSGTAAKQLADAILKELKMLKVDENPDKLISQSYDGAAVTSGRLGGVQKKIREHYPSAKFIHCYAHQLNLILQKAATQYKQIKIFFANLNSFTSFFGQSPKRTAVLDEFVKVREQNVVPKRWNFTTCCIETVYIYQQDIMNCMEKIIDNEEDKTIINQAIGLKGYLSDESFMYWLDFFYLLIPHADVLFKKLQSRNLDVALVQNYMSEFSQNIKNVKDSVITDFQCHPPITKRIKKEAEETDDLRSKIAIEICEIVHSEIRHRFEYYNHLIISQLLHSDKFQTYEQTFPQEVLNIVKKSYPSVNVLKLKPELEVIYSRMDFRDSSCVIAMLQLFIRLNLTETFSETVTLLNILCTLPMVTVESERCFSTLTRIKTFLRNTIGQSRLSALAMLSIEKDLMKNIDSFNDKVIDHFIAQRDHGIDLTYKQI